MKTGSYLEQAGYPTFHLDDALSGRGHPGKNLEQRRFTRAVMPDDTQGLSLFDFQRHILNCPDCVLEELLSAPVEINAFGSGLPLNRAHLLWNSFSKLLYPRILSRYSFHRFSIRITVDIRHCRSNRVHKRFFHPVEKDKAC